MTRENKLRRFQFKSIQNLILANQLLSKMKIKDRPYCERCRSSEETTPHFFVQCNEVKAPWKLAIDWWNERRTENLHPDQKEILYGYKPNSNRFHAFNHYFLIAEHHLYLERLKSEPPNLNIFFTILRHKIRIEEEIANKSNSFNEHQEK